MLTQVLLLGFCVIIGAQERFYYGDLEALPDQQAWNWHLNPGPLTPRQTSTSSKERDVEEVTENDREPLAPDYNGPTSKPAGQKPLPSGSFNPAGIPGGVVDVDAGGFSGGFPTGFPTGFPGGFPQIPDNFGFSSLGDQYPGGGLFGLGGFFGGGAQYKPWWKGSNVCIEREETTDDDREGPITKLNDTKSETVPNFFETAISLSNCFDTPNKYECVTKINNHGIVKTFVVRYKCCYGYQRSEGTSGCTKQVELKILLETLTDVGAVEFKKLISTSGLEDRFTTENITIFAPSNDALTEFTDNMLTMNQVDPARRRRQVTNALTSKDLILNHVTKGFVDISDLVNEEVLYSDNNNNSIRFNTYPTQNYEKMVTANCARVTKSNNLATNGIVHVIDGVFSSVEKSILDVIAQNDQLTNLRQVFATTNIGKRFKPDGHYTLFAPTDAAFAKLDDPTRQKLLRGDSCASSILSHHIVAHTVCSPAIVGNATTHNVDGEILNMERTLDDQLLLEDKARIVKSDIMATNGVIHLIDNVLIPESALYVSQALKSQNFTKFQKLIADAGLTEQLDLLSNVTVFAPSDRAFGDEAAVKMLDEMKGDPEKLKEIVNYHTVQGLVESCDMNNNVMLKTNDVDHTLRLNLYSTLPLFTNIINRATINCARLTGYDEKSCGSVIHEVNKLLIPPTKNIFELISSDDKYSTLSDLVNGTDVELILQNDNESLTLLAPTNEAFAIVDEVLLKSLKGDKVKASAFLKDHVITEILCCAGVGPQTWGFNSLVPTLSRQHQQISRTSGHQIRIGRSTVTSCDNLATNGVVHSINNVLIPQRSSSPGFGFFLFDF